MVSLKKDSHSDILTHGNDKILLLFRKPCFAQKKFFILEKPFNINFFKDNYRTPLSKQNKQILREFFMENSYANTQAKLLIAKHLDIPVWKVQFWFSNERKRLKKN